MEENAKGRDAMDIYCPGGGEILLPGGCWTPLDEGTLPCLGVEGLQLLPWAERPATTSLWCSSCSQGMGVPGRPPGPP